MFFQETYKYRQETKEAYRLCGKRERDTYGHKSTDTDKVVVAVVVVAVGVGVEYQELCLAIHALTRLVR